MLKSIISLLLRILGLNLNTKAQGLIASFTRAKLAQTEVTSSDGTKRVAKYTEVTAFSIGGNCELPIAQDFLS